MAYKIKIEPVSSGMLVSASTIRKGVAKSEAAPHEIVVEATSAQIQGVMNYLGLIAAASDTSTVETAITALTP